MGHAIDYLSFDYNTSRKAIYAECESYAAEDRDTHCPLEPIDYYDKQFNSREEAEEYIDKIDKHWYHQIAVSYRHQNNFKPSKALEKLQHRKAKAYNDYCEAESAFHFKNHKSQTVGCSKCGSKLALAYLKRNTCPLCGSDLRPTTTLEKIAKLKSNYDKLCKEYKAKEHEERMKNIKKAELHWLVKIEYHI